MPKDPREMAIAILEQDPLLSDSDLNEVVNLKEVIKYFAASRNLKRVHATLRTSRTAHMGPLQYPAKVPAEENA